MPLPPPDPDDMNDQRADWAHSAIQSFARECNAYEESTESLLGDLLCNLRHLCDRLEINFDVVNTEAAGMYAEETEPE